MTDFTIPRCPSCGGEYHGEFCHIPHKHRWDWTPDIKRYRCVCGEYPTSLAEINTQIALNKGLTDPSRREVVLETGGDPETDATGSAAGAGQPGGGIPPANPVYRKSFDVGIYLRVQVEAGDQMDALHAMEGALGFASIDGGRVTFKGMINDTEVSARAAHPKVLHITESTR